MLEAGIKLKDKKRQALKGITHFGPAE